MFLVFVRFQSFFASLVNIWPFLVDAYFTSTGPPHRLGRQVTGRIAENSTSVHVINVPLHRLTRIGAECTSPVLAFFFEVRISVSNVPMVPPSVM